MCVVDFVWNQARRFWVCHVRACVCGWLVRACASDLVCATRSVDGLVLYLMRMWRSSLDLCLPHSFRVSTLIGLECFLHRLQLVTSCLTCSRVIPVGVGGREKFFAALAVVRPAAVMSAFTNVILAGTELCNRNRLLIALWLHPHGCKV